MTCIDYQPPTLGKTVRSRNYDRYQVIESEYAAGTILRPHRHRFPALTIVLEGCYELDIDREAFDCSPHAVYFELGDSVHCNRVGTSTTRSLIIDLHHASDGDQFLHPAHHCMRNDPHVLNLSHSIRGEFFAQDAASNLAVEGLVLELLAAMSRGPVRNRKAPTPKWLKQAVDHIHSEYRHRLSLEVLAQSVGVHPTRLARKFRAHTGCSVGEYVRRIRLKQAGEELSRADSSLAEIASGLGFYDQAHFSRVFKKHFGCTPGAYRRALGGAPNRA